MFYVLLIHKEESGGSLDDNFLIELIFLILVLINS